MQIKTEAGKKALELKNAAIAFGIYGNGAKRLGDLALTNSGLVWSKGKTKTSKDVTVKWDAFIAWMQSQLSEQNKSKKTAKPRATAIANGKSIAAAPKAAKKTARAPKAPAKQAH
jgi:hypothetical protein